MISLFAISYVCQSVNLPHAEFAEQFSSPNCVWAMQCLLEVCTVYIGFLKFLNEQINRATLGAREFFRPVRENNR